MRVVNHCRLCTRRSLRRSGCWGRRFGGGGCRTLGRRRVPLILRLRSGLPRSRRARANGCDAGKADEKNNGQSHIRGPSCPTPKSQSYFMTARNKMTIPDQIHLHADGREIWVIRPLCYRRTRGRFPSQVQPQEYENEKWSQLPLLIRNLSSHSATAESGKSAPGQCRCRLFSS
jgi:hypothetical protein